MVDTIWLESSVTLCCCALSLLGSILVLSSYAIAASGTSRNIAADLIKNLSACDLIWFTVAGSEAIIWLTVSGKNGHESGQVPAEYCYVAAPLGNYARMASLMWTCCISYDVLMATVYRNWYREMSRTKVQKYRVGYHLFVNFWALPQLLGTAILQQDYQSDDDGVYGCRAETESGVPNWLVSIEFVPILLGLAFNIIVLWRVSGRMKKRRYPLSVRKRRKRIMYYYVLAALICWLPTVILYILSLVGQSYVALDLISRGLLYSSGLVNFIIFGMNDPHLLKSFRIVLSKLGCSCLIRAEARGVPAKYDWEVKNVMFADDREGNADRNKGKTHIMRYGRLSRSDKEALYHHRPDLNHSSKDRKARKSSTAEESLSEPLLADDEDGDQKTLESLIATTGAGQSAPVQSEVSNRSVSDSTVLSGDVGGSSSDSSVSTQTLQSIETKSTFSTLTQSSTGSGANVKYSETPATPVQQQPKGGVTFDTPANIVASEMDGASPKASTGEGGNPTREQNNPNGLQKLEAGESSCNPSRTLSQSPRGTLQRRMSWLGTDDGSSSSDEDDEEDHFRAERLTSG